MIVVVAFIFAFAFWLGLYLLARSSTTLALRLAGAGILIYALAVAGWALDLPGALVLVILTALCWMGAIGVELNRQRTTATAPPRPIKLLIVGAIFFALSVGAFVLPVIPLPRPWLLLAVGFDVAVLGIAIARLDAFAVGETLWPDLLRSLAGSALACVVFGGLMGLAGASVRWVLLTLACAITFQVFAAYWQSWLDRLVFVRQPQLQTARAELREVTETLPRLTNAFDPSGVAEAEFVRLTRRAISALGDLPKLTASPLTRLPAIERHLVHTPERDNPIERANLLRQLLVDGILLLKPAHANGPDTGIDNRAGFGTTDEWRHFNALYYPYVIGLKPYSLRAEYHDLDKDAQAALDWFRASVPERTLYNWQTAAAKLVANRLRTTANQAGANPDPIIESELSP